MATTAADRPAPGYRRARTLFRVGLACASAIAVLSLWVQIDGLAGSRGLTPAVDAQAAFEDSGWGGDWSWRPTLLWLDTSDAMLHGLCAAGVLLALLMLVDVAPALCALGLWAVYLSLAWAGGPFLNFQWDTLLIETLLLAAFWLPWRLRRAQGVDAECALARWLLWWLLVRFMFESGVVKLSSGDPTWADLSAMTYHYMTQPLPHGLSWFAHHQPLWAHEAAALGMFFVELVVPFFVLLPWALRLIPGLSTRAQLLPRRLAFPLLVGLQLVIGVTGNYGFFNLLTIVLCLPLLDDGLLGPRDRSLLAAPRAAWPRQLATAVFAVPVLLISGLQLHDLHPEWSADRPRLSREHVEQGLAETWRADGPATAARLFELRAQPFLSVNAYGLFRVMTTRRPEIVIQGSLDGEQWVDYAFRWQVGDVERAPGWVQPHMPRLDWQLWFEALRWEPAAHRRQPYSPSPWFGSLIERLLEAEPAVLALLADDPFDGAQPRAVRTTLFDDRFTTPEERDESGAWWHRERIYPTWLMLERED